MVFLRPDPKEKKGRANLQNEALDNPTRVVTSPLKT